MHLIEDNLQRIYELCRKYKVKSLYAFGSILTPRFNDDSDVDLLVNFNDNEVSYLNYADIYFDFHDSLRRLFRREVDLVDETTVKNKYFKEELDETKQLIYG